MITTNPGRQSAIRFILCLGVVSLLADMTYEGSRSILGPYLEGLGATAAQVGLIAGFGEMLAAGLRFFSGRLADRTRAYWPLVFLGYGINIVVVPALAFAGNWQAAALLVVAERTGKSLRGPARDVLLSSATKETGHGWGFGLHAAMDQTGAVMGPLLIAAVVAREQRFAPAFLVLVVPALLTVGALLVARAMHRARPAAPPEPRPAANLPGVFWPYIVAAGLLAAGVVDFPLLAFHFQRQQLAAPAAIPLLYATAMAVVGITALVLGRLFDRHGLVVLCGGIGLSLFALPLGFLGGRTAVVASIVCWAVGLGAQDATLRSGIAQVVSMDKRGTAFGTFNAVYGVMWFAGSAVMGLLYDRSIAALVGFGVLLQATAAVVFLRLRGRLAAGA